MNEENKPSFIKIGDSRIRLSNIKYYEIYKTGGYPYKMLIIQTYQGDECRFSEQEDDIDIDEVVKKLDLYLT